MNEPALTPEQWREWKSGDGYVQGLGRLKYADDNTRVRIYVATQPVDTPAEFRAAIAILLDALAQAGEPLFIEDDLWTVLDLQNAVESGTLTMEQLRIDALTNRLRSLLPPEGL